MDLVTARQILRTINGTIQTGRWGQERTTAVQRALSELYLLNPCDDVDGKIGGRTQGAWALFKEATGLAGPDTIDVASVAKLLEAVDDPAALIGKAKVELPPDFDFRRRQGTANRDRSSRAIIAAAKARQLIDPQTAYILATAEHESDSFNTLEEYDSGFRYENRSELGNSQKGDGARFKGRGFVQLTGRNNYATYTDITGINLVRLPLILMNWPALAVFVLVDGMVRGVFTGSRLDQHVNPGKIDFLKAREVVNGHDCAQRIAEKANRWLQQLNQQGFA